MDTLLVVTKRKKRKIRKCLDEMWKRSRNSSISRDLSNKKVLQNCEVGGKKNNCITSKRLTLTMFSKAVRSETVTRPTLDEDRTLNAGLQKPVISPTNIMKDSKSTNSTPTIRKEADILRQSDFENNEDTSNSMIMFSPIQQETRTLRDSTNEETLSSITSTNRSVEDFGYHLYEELMDDIPQYLRSNLPSLIKEDVINKTKISLQNIYFENLQKQYETSKSEGSCLKKNILSSDGTCTPKETIVENPMDYIKIGWRQSFQHIYHKSSPSDSNISPPQTPHTPGSPAASPPLHSVLPYTPDYEYYPHRLNE